MDVLIISGTVGAGKTTIAEVLAEALGSRGKKSCVLDVDALTCVYPAPESDPINEEIALDLLGTMTPIWTERGVEILILPRVIETPEARARYERVLRGACPGSLQTFRLCLIVSQEEIRLQRIHNREDHNPSSLSWHLNRTKDLAKILDEAQLEEFRVENDPPKKPIDLAEEIISKLSL